MEFVVCVAAASIILVMLAEVGVFQLVGVHWRYWSRCRDERALWWRGNLIDPPNPRARPTDWRWVVMASAVALSGILLAVVVVLLLGVPLNAYAILAIVAAVLAAPICAWLASTRTR